MIIHVYTVTVHTKHPATTMLSDLFHLTWSEKATQHTKDGDKRGSWKPALASGK